MNSHCLLRKTYSEMNLPIIYFSNLICTYPQKKKTFDPYIPLSKLNVHVLSGPGCSSVGYGASSELGPLLVNGNGTGLEFNKFAWTRGLLLSFLLWISTSHSLVTLPGSGLPATRGMSIPLHLSSWWCNLGPLSRNLARHACALSRFFFVTHF